MSNLIIAPDRTTAVTHLESLGEALSDWSLFYPGNDHRGKGHYLDRNRDRVIFLANPERDEWAAGMQAAVAAIGGPAIHVDGKIYEGGVLCGDIGFTFNVPETRQAVRELGFTWPKKSLAFAIKIEDCECGDTFEEHGDSIDPSCQIDGCGCEVWSP